MSTINEDRIRDRAYQLWLENGSPENMAEHFWIMAERQLANESAQAKSMPPVDQEVPGQLEEDITGRESGKVLPDDKKSSRRPKSTPGTA